MADLARTLKTGDETRTVDQIRADVLLDLLEGTRHNGRSRGTVDIHVDLTTLTRLTDDPGELAGYGPVIADIARQVAEHQPGAEWCWTLTHPDSGQVLDNGITRRRPTTSQRRHLQARNPTCIFPGCRRPALDCDLDHRQTFADGGPTTVDNLVPLCRHHHQVRHQAGWTHMALPNGDHQWTSQLGHTYTTSGLPP
jgi:HNH endonuclease